MATVEAGAGFATDNAAAARPPKASRRVSMDSAPCVSLIVHGRHRQRTARGHTAPFSISLSDYDTAIDWLARDNALPVALFGRERNTSHRCLELLQARVALGVVLERRDDEFAPALFRGDIGEDAFNFG